MFLNVCENSNFLSTVSFIKTIIEIIQIGVPIILILMCGIDLFRQIINTEDKSYQRILKRMIAAVTVFFVPTIATLVLDLVGTTNYSKTECWTNANTETIAVLKAAEKKEQEEVKKAKAEKMAKEKKAREEREKAREEIRKKNEELAKKAQEENSKNNNLSNVSDATFLKENGTDGMVTVVNGVFYKPATGTSGEEGTKGSGPHGYNIYFYNRLKRLVDDAAKKGYTIIYSTSEFGAWRPLSNQIYYYNCYRTQSCNNGNLAAVPGTSNHGWGIASDLNFGSYNAKLWAHDHAAEYGLSFSECENIRGYCVEDWHIQVANLQRR